jgi:transcriptional regulator with XRE-family HTH domain
LVILCAVLTKDNIETLRRSRIKGRNRLAKAMELAGLTQVQLAERSGLTQSYLSRIKNGHYSDLPGETMRALAETFGCAIEDLFPAREAIA